jgi:hypothetical protein
MRQLTLKTAHAFHDPSFPDIVFLIEKPEPESGGEVRAVAYVRRGTPTLALDLDCSRTLQLWPQCKKKRAAVKMMNIVSIAIYPRRAELCVVDAA